MPVSLEMVIDHWARAEGVSERAITYITNVITGNPYEAPNMVTALKELRERDGARPDFQALVDAVWDKLPIVIQEAKEGFASVMDGVLAIILA